MIGVDSRPTALIMEDDYETVMQWVFLLPDVNDPVLKAREAVLSLSREAGQHERLAREKRIAAHHALLTLESMVRRAGWTEDEIAAAKAQAKA